MSRAFEDADFLAANELEKKPEPAPKESAAHATGPATQRQSMNATSVLRLQRSIGNAGTAAYLQRDEAEGAQRSPVHGVIGSGGGTSLDAPTRTTMEQHLKTDLSDVRLHVDRESAESVQAAAYTVGNDVVLHPDHFSPGTPSAQRTLAHELTHVVQQRSGPVDGTPREGGIKVSDPSDRFEREAESSAESLMTATQRQTPSQASAGPSVQRVSLQREEESDEAEVQELPLQQISLQREGEEESDEAEVQELPLQQISLQREGEEESDEAEVQELPLQREGEEEMDEGDSEG